MAKAYIFYNPKAKNGQCTEDVKKIENIINDDVIFCDMTKGETYESRLFSMEKEDYLILCGGDGTLNHFINLVEDVEIKNDILYFPCGSGNDFTKDLGHSYPSDPFSMKEYITKLPCVVVNNKTYRFINGVGYGIDGYCCEEGDRQRETDTKTINYTVIAIKGLLFHYKPATAKVTVDGVTHTYKKVWLAPTMNGRFYGGGMMPTPDQKRNSGKLSAMVFHNAGKLKALMIFPSLFKGEHIRHQKYVEILTGNEITVTFDRPTSLQIDGETIVNVMSYTARSFQKGRIYGENNDRRTEPNHFGV